MLSFILFTLLALFYGAFGYFAFLHKSYIAFSSFALACLLVFPVVRILLKPKEAVGFIMLILSFVFFFAGVYTYPTTSIPVPTIAEISEYLRGPLLGIY